MRKEPGDQVIECHGCGSMWLIEFADFSKISAKLIECPLCELKKNKEKT